MRTIEFRAFSMEHNMYMVGFGVLPVEYTEKEFGYENEIILFTEFNGEIRCISETVGQFTGLKDKNGKKIFEGDIVEVTGDEDYEFTSIVEYFGEGDYPAFDMRAPEDYYFESNTFSEILMSSSYELGVIGNIHENPELLEVATC
ncbi:TPA: hypothetical protein U0U57_002163 [Listeria monocytogenes]|uniref:YopX family protein n=1 Tax=Listeria monocytogenes TaxID=1639 RepID=UPI000BE10492|nr:YopX family protein [Listeria monocytogenes]EAE3702086.1 hypothetical protein [Listeria monocytogenes serotype 1/2c]EAD3838202.1 hypothetical protein [Listeria monocytogenes]EAF3421697.1 hypothetical protein [Listeria monocytogenes]EBB5865002.1 hypothetical protein [Listeria monocytogenes]PDM04171.1 hypothetical protein CDR96_00355 [Listeria monocytogenes]